MVNSRNFNDGNNFQSEPVINHHHSHVWFNFRQWFRGENLYVKSLKHTMTPSDNKSSHDPLG